MTRTCNVRSWNTKRTLGEYRGHRNELRTLVNNEESILVHSLLQVHRLHVEDVNNLENSVQVWGGGCVGVGGWELSMLSAQCLCESKTIRQIKFINSS